MDDNKPNNSQGTAGSNVSEGSPPTPPETDSLSQPPPEPTFPSPEDVPAPPPVATENVDVPPPPQVISSTDQANQATQTGNGETAPPPVVPTTPIKAVKGKKPRLPNKKILVPTILALVILTGGIGAGVLLIQRGQDIRERAESPEDTGPPQPASEGELCGGLAGITCQTGLECIYNNGTTTASFSDESGTCQLIEEKVSEPTIECLETAAYQVEGDIEDVAGWTALTPTELTKLSAGDVIYIVVTAKSDLTEVNGGFSQVKFTINGEEFDGDIANVKPPTITTPGNYYEYYYEYEIPEGVTDFELNASLYNEVLDVWI